MRPQQEPPPRTARAQPCPGLPRAIREPGCEPAVAHVLDAAVVQRAADRYRSRYQTEVPELLRFLVPSLPSAEMFCLLALRAINTIMKWQHPDGGFGGGSGQAAHLLPTYAAVCSLAIVGRPGPGGGWDQIDRCVLRLYRFNLFPMHPEGISYTSGICL